MSFFHSWRRKLGCVTLVIACVLMGMWARSLFVVEAVALGFGGRQHIFLSDNGYVFWFTYSRNPTMPYFNSGMARVGNTYHMLTGMQGPEPYAFGLEATHARRLPYWLGIWTSVLLSAYLLLWKPRVRTATLD